MDSSTPKEFPPQDEAVVVSSHSSPAEGTPKDGNEKQSEDHFMSGAKLHILVLGLGFAVFLMALDMSILVTAIPIITEKFQSVDDIGWYMSGYLLTL